MTGERVLRLNALCDVVLGALFLLAPWDALFDALDLPQPSPALYAQVIGALLLGYAYFLWVAPREDATARAAAAAASVAHLVGNSVLVAWLLFGDLDVGTQGKVELWIVVALGTVLMVLEARLASRRLAFVLPQD